jgi:4-hydroxybenzoate polyprenyltransferase
LPFWLLKGKAYTKQQIARRVRLDVASLPYHAAFLDYLIAERRSGRTLLLVTAADQRIAHQIARHLGIFDEVLASDGKTNLSGRRKLQVLQKRFGEKGFVYAGYAPIDMTIWEHAQEGIAVSSSARLVDAARKVTAVQRVFTGQRTSFRTLLSAIRVYQWVKNLLVFVALLTSHRVTDFALVLDASYAFIAFSLCASSVYLLNDLLDLEADRHHHTKRQRPFAAGDLPLLSGMVLIPLFIGAAVAVSFLLPRGFQLILGVYFLLTLAYSFSLKAIVLVDVLVLTGLYTLRIIAGASAIGVPISYWLQAFSLFLFLSLALLKRYSELQQLRLEHRESSEGRGYLASDLEQIDSLGTASGYVAVLVLALYINSPEVVTLYTRPEWLWLLCPSILYWISRIWLLAHRGQVYDDPVVFALRDRVSYVIGVFVILAMLPAL